MYRSRPYPNGWREVACFVACLPPSRSSPWLPESATEWMASASIDEDPVRKKAMNLVTAMPRLAARAAKIAFVPPSVLTSPSLRSGDDRQGCVHDARLPRYAPDLSWRNQILHLGHSRDGHRVEAVGKTKVDRGEVRDGHERGQALQGGA